MSDTFEWLEPWYPIADASMCAGLEGQLRLELSPRHILHDQSVRLIARRSDTDDALFQLARERVAEVHLTWSKQVEEDPRWPATAVYSSLAEWGRESMIPLHRELFEGR